MLPKENDYDIRVNEIPSFREMRLKLDDSNYMASQQRLHSAIYATVENKFEALVKISVVSSAFSTTYYSLLFRHN